MPIAGEVVPVSDAPHAIEFDTGHDTLPPMSIRIAAAVLAICMALVCVLSPIAEAHELHHDCTGIGCAVCAELAGNLSLAQRGSVPHSPIDIAALLMICAIAVIGITRSSYAPVTLISLKVRLDD